MELDEDENQEAIIPTGDPHLDQLQALIREHGSDTIFPPLDGTSFYRGICKVNHSCVPNVLVTYQSSPLQPGAEMSGGLVSAVRVLRLIAIGEELVQAYIDTELGKIISTHLSNSYLYSSFHDFYYDNMIHCRLCGATEGSSGLRLRMSLS